MNTYKTINSNLNRQSVSLKSQVKIECSKSGFQKKFLNKVFSGGRDNSLLKQVILMAGLKAWLKAGLF